MNCTIVKRNGKTCGAHIHGMTGLQELENLGRHIRRAHGNTLTMLPTLAELRCKMEDGELIYCVPAKKG